MYAAIGAAVLVPLLLWAAFRLWMTARRLDRLHKRTEAAWSACEEALARRIVAARALAATATTLPKVRGELRAATVAADEVDRADRPGRDAAESRLSRVLASLDEQARGDLAQELADAEERVALAHRFYNDAVRDTRALRASWFTRFFRLAGRAQLPNYFGLASDADAEDAAAR